MVVAGPERQCSAGGPGVVVAEGEQSSQDWDGAAWCFREKGSCAAGWED